MLKRTLQHCHRVGALRRRGVRDEGKTTRSPTLWERGLGVRAKQHAPSRTQARGIWSAEAKLPLDAEANASALHRVGALRGRGVRDEGKTARALPHAGEGDMECGSFASARR
jgi:hypothetical protein